MSSDDRGSLDLSVPQWKRDLILRRRAVGRVLPAGTGSVQLTCPSVVAAVRYPESSAASVANSLVKTCANDHEQVSSRKNMRLVERLNVSGDLAESGLLVDPKIENYSVHYLLNMGEEKNCDKKAGSPGCLPSAEKKCIGSELLVNEEGESSDSGEELKYGPGIVSRLKSRYLSLTLRESQGRMRPSLPYMRRATSLENILDGPDVGKCEDSKPKYQKKLNAGLINGTDRCRSVTRGNKDSMKRAGSVETLIRGRGPFGRRNRESPDREKIVKNTFFTAVEEKELPPPDVVKHTLKIFEENSSKSAKGLSVSAAKCSNDAGGKLAKRPATHPKPSVASATVGKSIKREIKNAASPADRSGETSDRPNIGLVSDEGSPAEKGHCNVKGIPHKFTSSDAAPATPKAFGAERETERPDFCELAANDSQADNTDGEAKPAAEDFSGVRNGDVENANPAEMDGGDKSRAKRTASADVDRLADAVANPESLRSVSPVLAKAPPSILCSEVNACSPVQNHMKQLGVVRPIVTNKNSHSGHAIPLRKCSANKTHPFLTEREIEKNLINSVKSIEQPVTKVIVSLKKSAEECIVPCVNECLEESKKTLVWDNRKQNSMVFNFSSRKTIPDYIENDGLVLTARRGAGPKGTATDHSPKLAETGFIFLGGGTFDSSNDFDLDDTDPPSPCDFIFEGDNILINGKSNIQSRPKVRKMKVHFDDEATTMFEYPSEASLLDDQEISGVGYDAERNDTSVNGGIASGAAAPPNPFRCGNLASYTPSKVTLSKDFQLGVTKTLPTLPVAPRSEPPHRDQMHDEYLRPADETTTVTWSSETAADLLF